MKKSLIKPILFFLAVFVAVSLACGSTPEPTQAPEVVQDPEVVDPPEQPEVVSPSGPVSDLEGVRGAVIQIEAQGTFVDSQIGEYVKAGRGTGFIIDPSGLAVTNNHVVTGAALLKVWVGGDTSKTYNARILGVSECSDLALIDIDGEGFPYLEWYQEPVKVGLDVYAVGFPLGEPEYTLTKGIISKESAGGDSDWASISSVIMHDATVNPGNSGGPLVTPDGKVVAVNYRARSAQDQYFAIGREIATPIIDKLKIGENVDSIGVNGRAVSSEDGSIVGIWVSSVQAGSVADQAGIKGGDILTRLQGFPLASDDTLSEYCNIIRTHSPSDTIGIEVLRYATNEVLEGQLNGNALTLSYYFGESPEVSDEDPIGDPGPTGDATGDYIAITDTYNALYLDVPAWYSDVTDTIWEDAWGNFNFTAAALAAAPDLESYLDYYDAPGVILAASKDWGRIGGYIQLLDNVRRYDYPDCNFEGRFDYDDDVFEGAFDLFTCTPGAKLWVLAVRQISDPVGYLVLMQVKTVDDIDPEFVDLQRMFDTFDVNKLNLP